MKKVLAITTINNTISLKEALNKIKGKYGNIVKIRKIYLDKYEDPKTPLDDIKREISESDVILVDIRGDERLGRKLPHLLAGREKTVISLVWSSHRILSLTRIGKLNMHELIKELQKKGVNINPLIKEDELKNIIETHGPHEIKEDLRKWFKILEYYKQSNPENLKNMLLYILREYCDLNINKIPEPVKMPKYGLYHPYKGVYKDLEEYKTAADFKPELNTIGILFYSGMHFDDTRPLVEALYENLYDKVNCIIVFSDGISYNIKALKEYMMEIDLFINLQYFQIHGGPYGGDPQVTYQLMEEINAPYLICLRGHETDLNEWETRDESLKPMEVILAVTLPELDGGIEPFFTAAMRTKDDEDLGKIRIVEVLPERMEKFSKRILNWLKLKNKENHEKKIAIVIYNYPPGEGNLGSAGYLDVFKSLEIFLKKLKKHGYKIRIPKENLKDLLLENGIINTPRYLKRSGHHLNIKEYTSWFKKLPEKIQENIIEYWGEPPGNIMTDQKGITLPILDLGGVYLCVQPSRGVHEDPENYHSKDLPPHHQYLAFYHYLEDVLKVDAIIHFGMHGTLEFTPGKETGLSSSCYPDLLIGTIPHIYYYWVGNTSESTIAKRRSYALCISHASPPMRPSDLYGEYLILEDLLEEYREEEGEETLKLIKEKAETLNMPTDLDEIEKELHRMKKRLIPSGLHYMDREWSLEEQIDYLLGVLRFDREHPSILKILSKRFKKLPPEKLEKEARKILKDILEDKIPEHLPKDYIEWVKELSKTINFSSESKSLIKALNGEYIKPNRGGDPIKDPETYPTGYSMFAFDPMKIPTVASENRGRKAAELLIKEHLKYHGKYPETIGIILWGFETLKTGGDTISMILELLGLRLTRKYGPWVKKFEVIPLEELGRPRVDVVVNICGIFRDTLGTQIDLLNRAFKQVAELNEPEDMNYIRKHYLEDKSLARIFGPSPKEYATNLPQLVENSSWDEEEELSDAYRDCMSYAYLPDGIKREDEILKKQLARVDIVTQERDNVEYEVTDLDHYYEFLGGLSSSVKACKGEEATIKVIDSTEEEIYIEDLDKTIERAARTRILNPKWLDGMLKHDFHGAKHIRDRIEHLLGFSATTDKVENWIYENVADKLILDPQMRKKLLENNPFATIEIGEILLETERRGYWKTSKEKIQKIRETLISIEYQLE
ncbi:MAG TPA: cobaltochelatase subunit CobN [Methanobacteriales archaeon]|nr:MAG: Magnesium chelatase subunit [Methanobacteriaceae archaeon 41_258]MBC7089503.1 cobaltochelatase subunit CobN [Methanobacteriaceae archaeon]HIH61255.1 cobaltochelatase subunit CobN [Methanobacteriales archaeon]